MDSSGRWELYTEPNAPSSGKLSLNSQNPTLQKFLHRCIDEFGLYTYLQDAFPSKKEKDQVLYRLLKKGADDLKLESLADRLRHDEMSYARRLWGIVSYFPCLCLSWILSLTLCSTA